MDFERSKNLVRSFFGPAILVISSQDANEVCLKNGVTFCELLQPFAQAPYEGEADASGHARRRDQTRREQGFVSA
jgi:hypothetical protein